MSKNKIMYETTFVVGRCYTRDEYNAIKANQKLAKYGKEVKTRKRSTDDQNSQWAVPHKLGKSFSQMRRS